MFVKIVQMYSDTVPLRGRQLAFFVLMMGVSMSAFSSTATWKEEVLLHDGSKIIVTRSQIREGRHEIGQGLPIKEHTVTFAVPGTSKTIAWKSDDQDFNGLGLHLILLDFIDGMPYIATHPAGCLAYNKWGRPNPPYVFFKYDGQWKQIPLAEFPEAFKHLNVVVSTYEESDIKEKASKSGIVTVDSVDEINSDLKQEELRGIVRAEVKSATTDCPDYSSPRYSSPKAPLPIPPVR